MKIITKIKNKFIFVSIFLLSFLFNNSVLASNSDSNELNLISAFTYNFLKFTNWKNKTSIIHVAILANPDLVIDFKNVIQGKQIQGQNIEVLSLDTLPSDLNPEVAIIIPKNNSTSVEKSLNSLKNCHCLTVAYNEGMAHTGLAVINFYLEADKLKFEVNLKNASSSGIELSSQLLKLAKIVSD